MSQPERSILPHARQSVPSLFVGDHVALDLLNTQYLLAGNRMDTLNSDADVFAWLAQAGQPTAGATLTARKSGTLLAAVRTLREVVRRALEQRKRGAHIDVRALNDFLKQGKSCLQLTTWPDGRASVHRQWGTENPAQVLAPLAEAAADLLADPAPELIRQCEDERCVLWFYDRTKAHRRRWCSPATCGNRHKVAALRQRRRDGAS